MKNSLKELHDAEDFFLYYRVPFHQEILNISRMQILKKFNFYLKEESFLEVNLEEKELWNIQRALLIRAYNDFVKPTPLRRRFFSEFYKRNGQFIPFDSFKGEDKLK